MQWFSIPEVATRLDASPATVRGLIEDGQLDAVNIARKSSVRKRWRISEKAMVDFERRRGNDTHEEEPEAAQRLVARPTKNYFAKAREARAKVAETSSEVSIQELAEAVEIDVESCTVHVGAMIKKGQLASVLKPESVVSEVSR